MKRILLIIFFVGMYGSMAVHAQTPARVSIAGTVTDYDTKEPLPGCVVAIPQFSLWAVTDDTGAFRIASVSTGTYDIEVSYLGYEKLAYNVTVSKEITNLKLEIKPLTLALDQVVVTATQGNRLNTSTRIDRQAMEHTQASTIKGYMDLLPGAVMKNQNPYTASVISLRDIQESSGNANGNIQMNAFGTNIMVNGANINDKASISSGTSPNMRFQSAESGFDTRQLSMSDVESIEVITGVASAEYGDMNTGTVIITTKSGRTPLEFSAQTTSNSKIFALSKGMKLGENGGFLNVGADYMKAYSDVRTDAMAYNREGFNARYSHTFNNNNTPLRFNLSVSGYISKGITKPDPDRLLDDELSDLNNYSMSFNAYGTWQINKPWLTALRYNANYRFNNAFSRDYRMTGDSPDQLFRRYSLVEGMEISSRPDGSARVDLRNESKAAYSNVKLAADIADRYGSIYNKFSIGAEWRNTGNRGRGEYYIGEQYNGMRAIDARDYLPFVNNYEAFAEDQISLPFNRNKSSVSLSAGVRFMMVDTDILKQNSVFDPRFNLKYNIIENNRGHNVKELSVRGGWGIQSAMPTLSFMYNLPKYQDRTLLTWSREPNSNPPREAGRLYNIRVVSPEEQVNPDLKIARSHNFELGVDFDMFGIKGFVVYFNEQVNNAYAFNGNIVTPDPYRVYSLAGIDDRVSVPYLQNGELYFNGELVPYTVYNQFRTVNVPENSNRLKKWGVQYSLNFGQIRAIRTSVVLDGTYIERKNYSGGDYLSWGTYPSSSTVSVGGVSMSYPFAAAYINGSSATMGQYKTEFTNNLQLITHIPKLRMVTTLTIQGILIRTERYLPPPDLYHMDENGNRVYGDYTSIWEGSGSFPMIYRDPVFYKDINNQVHPYTTDLLNDPVYGNAFDALRIVQRNRNYYILSEFTPYFMGRIRVTKEISSIAQVSFSATNFTSYNPRIKLKNVSMYQRANTDFYFEAEVKFKF